MFAFVWKVFSLIWKEDAMVSLEGVHVSKRRYIKQSHSCFSTETKLRSYLYVLTKFNDLTEVHSPVLEDDSPDRWLPSRTTVHP